MPAGVDASPLSAVGLLTPSRNRLGESCWGLPAGAGILPAAGTLRRALERASSSETLNAPSIRVATSPFSSITNSQGSVKRPYSFTCGRRSFASPVAWLSFQISWWMNATSSPYSALTCSATSTTGPQTRLRQSAGVAKRRTTGFSPRTSARSSPCIELGGVRVSIDSTSPPTSASVGVCISGAGSPTLGISLSSLTITLGLTYVATRPSAVSMAAASRHSPVCLKGTSAT